MAMSFVETITIPHAAEHPVYAALYDSVENASFLRQQLLAGNVEFEYAFLDASMVRRTLLQRRMDTTY